MEGGVDEGWECRAQVAAPGGRDTRAFGLIGDALAQAGFQRGEVDAVVVGLGPGSYTGIRAAIAVAQGWQLGAGIDLAGVSSIEALAWGAERRGLRGEVQLIVDAQRGEFYAADYSIGEGEVRLAGALRLAGAEAVAAAQGSERRPLAGPDSARRFPGATDLIPEAKDLVRGLKTKTPWVSGGTLEPVYLRPVSFVKAPPPRKIPPM